MTDETKRIVDALRTCHSNEDCRDCKYLERDRDEMSCVNVLFVESADMIEDLCAELEQAGQGALRLVEAFGDLPLWADMLIAAITTTWVSVVLFAREKSR